MKSVVLTIIILAILDILKAQPLDTHDVADSTLLAKRDSVLDARYSTTKQKKIELIESERRLKYNLIRLVLLTQGEYLNYFNSTEFMFFKINQYPNNIKTQMLLYAFGGGVAKEFMKYSRHFLSRHDLGFVYPTLSGLNLYYRIPELNSRLRYRTTGIGDNYYALYLNKPNLIFFYRTKDSRDQRGVYVEIANKWRLVGVNSRSKWATVNSLGILKNTHDFYFYLVYQKNMDFHRDRISFFFNIGL